MVIYLDNIIFNMQQSGEESSRWAQFIRDLLPMPGIQLRFVEYRNAIANEHRYKLDLLRRGHLYVMRNLWLTRHLAVRIDGYTTPFIFHSSGYRLCDSPNAVNIITVDHHFKPSLHNNYALRRCDRIISTSRAVHAALPLHLKVKSTVVSTKKSNTNIALSVLKLYRSALAAAQSPTAVR